MKRIHDIQEYAIRIFQGVLGLIDTLSGRHNIHYEHHRLGSSIAIRHCRRLQDPSTPYSDGITCNKYRTPHFQDVTLNIIQEFQDPRTNGNRFMLEQSTDTLKAPSTSVCAVFGCEVFSVRSRVSFLRCVCVLWASGE